MTARAELSECYHDTARPKDQTQSHTDASRHSRIKREWRTQPQRVARSLDHQRRSEASPSAVAPDRPCFDAVAEAEAAAEGAESAALAREEAAASALEGVATLAAAACASDAAAVAVAAEPVAGSGPGAVVAAAGPVGFVPLAFEPMVLLTAV